MAPGAGSGHPDGAGAGGGGTAVEARFRCDGVPGAVRRADQRTVREGTAGDAATTRHGRSNQRPQASHSYR
ncbi:hypothetical protein C5L38_00600 [Streptomyces sp. WAC00288]|nr:hypothetical protein C5L38_00600 [Streptomyces sp. WAC00288]KYG51813.1 hypothetical protein AWI43_31085 [Streptomyces sp. WAC04657]